MVGGVFIIEYELTLSFSLCLIVHLKSLSTQKLATRNSHLLPYLAMILYATLQKWGAVEEA